MLRDFLLQIACLRLFQLGTCPAVLAKAAHFRSARLDALDADDILFTPRVLQQRQDCLEVIHQSALTTSLTSS